MLKLSFEISTPQVIDLPSYFNALHESDSRRIGSLNKKNGDFSDLRYAFELRGSEILNPRFSTLASFRLIQKLCKIRVLGIGCPFEPYIQSSEPQAFVENPPHRHAKENSYRFTALSHRNLRPDVLMCANRPGAAPNTTQRFGDRSWYPITSFPNMVLNLDTLSTFEEYLAARPQKWRSSFRRNIRHFYQCGHRLTCTEKSPVSSERLYEGYLTFFNRAPVKWMQHTPEYFQRMSQQRGVYWINAMSENNAWLGSILLFNFADKLEAGRIMIPPSRYRHDRIYFNLFYALIASAMKLEASQLSLEPTAYRAKKRLGADLVETHNLLSPVSLKGLLACNVLKSAGGWILPLLRPEADLYRY